MDAGFDVARQGFERVALGAPRMVEDVDDDSGRLSLDLRELRIKARIAQGSQDGGADIVAETAGLTGDRESALAAEEATVRTIERGVDRAVRKRRRIERVLKRFRNVSVKTA